jgi:hypothetical protein
VFISCCTISHDGGSGTPSMGSGGHRWRARVCRSTWNYSAPQAAGHQDVGQMWWNLPSAICKAQGRVETCICSLYKPSQAWML